MWRVLARKRRKKGLGGEENKWEGQGTRKVEEEEKTNGKGREGQGKRKR